MTVYFYKSYSIWQVRRQAKIIQRTSENIQQYYTLRCLISYLLSNCFNSEFCKQIWTKRKLASRHDTWCVTSEVEYFCLVEKTTCQSGSFNWMNNNLCKSCHVVRLPVSPNLLKIHFWTVQYRCIFVLIIWTLLCVIWMLLRELDNK